MPFWQIFLGCLDEYIDETIAIYNSISDLDIEAALTVSNADINRSFNARTLDVLPDLVKLNVDSRWRQGEPYNHVLNSMAGKSNPNNYWSAGCAAVAMGHIMAYYEWPLKPPSLIRQSVNILGLFHQFSGSPKNNFYDPFSNTNKSFSGITYDWKSMKSQSQWIYPPASPYTEDDKKNLLQIGVLMLAIGDKTGMKYTDGDGSGASWGSVINGFEAFGYNIGPEKESYDFERVKNMLKESKPVMMGGSREWLFESSGHYWIIDGYMSTNTADYIFCIPGWGEEGVGWYKSGVFDMKAPIKNPPGTVNPRNLVIKKKTIDIT